MKSMKSKKGGVRAVAQVRSALGLAVGRARIGFRKYGVAERNIERVWCGSRKRSGTSLGCQLGCYGQRCRIQNDRLDQ